MNFDKVLNSYEVQANTNYDLDRSGAALHKQTFSFDYEGQAFGTGEICNRTWLDGDKFKEFDKLASAGGTIAFPSNLLDEAGFGSLAKPSLLGTGRTEETGASMYVGVGPPGNSSSQGDHSWRQRWWQFHQIGGN